LLLLGFFGLEIHYGISLFNLAKAIGYPGLEKHSLSKSSLACTSMARKSHIPHGFDFFAHYGSFRILLTAMGFVGLRHPDSPHGKT
jgi:hypothetical protein